jgi:Flp pilus assembly protein TadD
MFANRLAALTVATLLMSLTVFAQEDWARFKSEATVQALGSFVLGTVTHPICWRIYDEGAECDLRQPVEHTPSTSIVTLHQLSHRVPRPAAKEYDRAVKAKEKGDQENAMAHFNRAIAIDPEFCDAINDLGVLYLDAGRTDQAIERFTKAAAVDPHAALPYLNLALAYLRQNQLVDGERAARQAMDLDRGDPYGPLVLGISLVLEGKFTAEAESSLEKAARDFVFAKFWLAVGLVERGDVAKAKYELRTYLAHVKNTEVGIAGALLNRLESAGQKTISHMSTPDVPGK